MSEWISQSRRGDQTQNRKHDHDQSREFKDQRKMRMLLLLFSPKKQRLMNSSDRIEEMIKEIEDYSWDAILTIETWRSSKVDGRLKEDTFLVEKHAVAILLNKNWRYRIVDTDHISERAISTTNKQKFMQMSVCFSHSGLADHHVERLLMRSKGALHIIGGDFNAELGLVKGIKRRSVGQQTF